MAISQTNPFGQMVQNGARARFVEGAPTGTRASRNARVTDNPARATPAVPAPETPRAEESGIPKAEDVEKVTGSPRIKTSKALVDFYT